MTHSERPADSRGLAAQAVKLMGLVEYQAGAIVSRTLIDKPAGTLTLFAFDAPDRH